MGDPTDTTTTMLHAFHARYAAFRDELPRHHQAAFDDLYRDAVRAATALNRHPTMDSERPILMAMLAALQARTLQDRRDVRRLQTQVDTLTRALEDHALVSPLRATRFDGTDLDRLGQERLTNYPLPNPVPS